ncbi:dihydrofolate reductase [Fusobacterium necrogenes]|uniref:dihydrofolate reductase n=1 Tax=Fusobacterium necrogenes TaxID=858 RepID=UPI00255C8260|nr:dihydrofolate reductase [Fusobacterium necrogenes]
MKRPEVNIIVCVAKNNLIGDKTPTGNGLLWHSKEELAYYKEKTVGNVVIFGKNTAKYVPIELMKKNRDVIVISSKDNFDEIIDKYKNTDKKIFICGGATVYKAYLEKYPVDNIYISKLKPHVEVSIPSNPLYFPKVEDFGYTVLETKEYQDFIAYTYKKKR